MKKNHTISVVWMNEWNYPSPSHGKNKSRQTKQMNRNRINTLHAVLCMFTVYHGLYRARVCICRKSRRDRFQCATVVKPLLSILFRCFFVVCVSVPVHSFYIIEWDLFHGGFSSSIVQCLLLDSLSHITHTACIRSTEIMCNLYSFYACFESNRVTNIRTHTQTHNLSAYEHIRASDRTSVNNIQYIHNPPLKLHYWFFPFYQLFYIVVVVVDVVFQHSFLAGRRLAFPSSMPCLRLCVYVRVQRIYASTLYVFDCTLRLCACVYSV